MHLLFGLILVLSSVCNGQSYGYCGKSYYNGSSGAIVSPNYPSSYSNSANCTYILNANVASNITLTFQLLDTEYHDNCTYDWVQISCKSHMIGLSYRFCGHNKPLNSIILSPCKQVEVFFRSDGFHTFYGFSLRYQVNDIECPDNCTLITNLYGFVCSCGQNNTNLTMPTPPLLQGCFSNCSLSTSTRLPAYCTCPMTDTPTRITTPFPCPLECPESSPESEFSLYDFDVFQSCECNPIQAPSPSRPPLYCSIGCYSRSDRYGDEYCYCPTTTHPPPTGCNQTLTASFGTITSPNYPLPYTKGIDCKQIIKDPAATSINLRIIDLDVHYSNSYSCVYEYIQITGCDGSTSYYCASYTFPTGGLTLQCPGGVSISVLFHTYSGTHSSYRGFKMAYSTDTQSNCSGYSLYLTKSSSGSVTSPNYPSNFPTISECFSYLFTDDDNIKISITFDILRLEDSSICQGVFLKLTCQDEDNGYSRTVCGSTIPPPITFQCRVLQIWFKSNVRTSYSPRNFRLRYYALDSDPSTKNGNQEDRETPLPQRGGEANDLSPSSKLRIGLGLGMGGFFLILFVVIIIFIVFSQRQLVRNERRQMEELPVICGNMGGGPRRDDDCVRICRSTPSVFQGPTAAGFFNPQVDTQPRDPPSYRTDWEAIGCSTTA